MLGTAVGGGLFGDFLGFLEEPLGVEVVDLDDLLEPLGDLLPDLDIGGFVTFLRSADLGEPNGDLVVTTGDLLWDLGEVNTGDWLFDRPMDFNDILGE